MGEFDRAACGLLSTDPDGTILDVNKTMLDWLGRDGSEVVGRKFVELLSAGGRIYHETHYAPMLSMQGSAREIAFDLIRADGRRLPVLVNARLDRHDDAPLIHVAVFDATERRMYERELLSAKQRAEQSESQVRILARTLQDTLLPHRVPAVPGLDVAAVYLAAGAGHEIGGDFYDVFQIGRDDWVIALGDVEGKGVQAAIVTALVRYTIRAASVEHEPDGVLRIVNEVMRRDEHPHYCTAVVLRCRKQTDHWIVTIAAGGHPLPILATADHAEPVGAHGTILGMFEQVRFTNTDVALDQSAVLIAYTDGITEARQGSKLLGENAVCELAAANAAQPSRIVLDAIVAEAVRFGGSPNRDDIAAIAIKSADQPRVQPRATSADLTGVGPP